MTTSDEFLAGAVDDCVTGGIGPYFPADEIPLPNWSGDDSQTVIFEPEEGEGVAAVERELRTSRSGDQRTHDICAVQLRAANFSPAMIQKAGRLYVAGMWEANGDQAFQVLGDSDEWHTVRVWGSLTWLATCTCPARASRWNRSGACAHRALGGWLRSQIIKRPIPRWPDLYFAALTQENHP